MRCVYVVVVVSAPSWTDGCRLRLVLLLLLRSYIKMREVTTNLGMAAYNKDSHLLDID